MAELVDALGSGSSERSLVGVRFPPSAPFLILKEVSLGGFFLYPYCNKYCKSSASIIIWHFTIDNNIASGLNDQNKL